MIWLSRQYRLRLSGNLMLRFEPVLIGFEIDGYFEFPTTGYENGLEIAEMAKCVTLCNSNNELVWSNALFARGSLQT